MSCKLEIWQTQNPAHWKLYDLFYCAPVYGCECWTMNNEMAAWRISWAQKKADSNVLTTIVGTRSLIKTTRNEISMGILSGWRAFLGCISFRAFCNTWIVKLLFFPNNARIKYFPLLLKGFKVWWAVNIRLLYRPLCYKCVFWILFLLFVILWTSVCTSFWWVSQYLRTYHICTCTLWRLVVVGPCRLEDFPVSTMWMLSSCSSINLIP